MKILTIAIPSYNSENYLEKCVESLLVGGEEVEILIVDDGSTDRTAEIADSYQKKYPTIVRAIHQENGGHGAAVNTGIRNASGIYYKVVDSDDWVSERSYKKILSALEDIIKSGSLVDMVLSNFVYEKEGAKHKRVMNYRNAFPEEKVFTWKEMKFMYKWQYILMHSVIYRTQLLIDCGLELPRHTFYVDNIFVFQPLPFVKTMYYVNTKFYRYYIGRDDQSVNEEVMIKRIDQQIKVNKIMIDIIDMKSQNKRMLKYMIKYLDIIMTVSSIMLIRSGTEENIEKKNELWNYLKQKDKKLYYKLRFGVLGRSMNLPGKSGRKMSVMGYKIAQKFIGFN